MVEWVGSPAARAKSQHTVGTLVPQILERPLRPDEDTLDDLERAFRETPVGPAGRKARQARTGARRRARQG